MYIQRRRISIRQRFFRFIKRRMVINILIILTFVIFEIWQHQEDIENYFGHYFDDDPVKELNIYELNSNDNFEKLLHWNRTLCSRAADRRGPHQKVINLSIYGTTSNFSNNPMFSWEKSILPYLEPLANEVKLLLPSWTIRLYIDFTGTKRSQRRALSKYSNVDICNMENLPFFGSLLFTFLPGKMWRFLPIFDPFVDYTLSRDLDSPITQRETDTLNIWLSDAEKNNIFHIARDHPQHGISILGGLWGAANVRARDYLMNTFQPMLTPSIAVQYSGAGDQEFLSRYVWDKVKDRSLSFDSYNCILYKSRPFPSQRPKGLCYLGCIRACCTNTGENEYNKNMDVCPEACRPEGHKNWTYC